MPYLTPRFLPTFDHGTTAVGGLAGAGAAGDTPAPIRRRSRSILVRPLLVLAALALAVLTSSAALAQVPGSDPDGTWSDPDGEWINLDDSSSGMFGASLSEESSLFSLWSTHVCGPTDTLTLGQQRIDQGRYQEAIDIFTCIIDASPLTVDAYRGRSEANLMLGRYADALRDYARLTAVVAPTNPGYPDTINAGYDARLAANPWNVRALAGASFARWCFYDMEGALPLVNRLILLRPFSVYANLFRGSTRLFLGVDVAAGKADFDRAILFSPFNAHVRFIVADGYTYAQPDLTRAYTEATYALSWGLDTPRVHAILAAALLSTGNLAGAAVHLKRHFDLVTIEMVASTVPLGAGSSATLALVPGRTYKFPVQVTAGQTLSIRTTSPTAEIGDSILVLLAPDGTPVTGNDDFIDFLAGFDWVAPQTATYQLQVTSFEGVGTGQLVVTRN